MGGEGERWVGSGLWVWLPVRRFAWMNLESGNLQMDLKSVRLDTCLFEIQYMGFVARSNPSQIVAVDAENSLTTERGTTLHVLSALPFTDRHQMAVQSTTSTGIVQTIEQKT